MARPGRRAARRAVPPRRCGSAPGSGPATRGATGTWSSYNNEEQPGFGSKPMTVRRVLSVGQCTFDDDNIRQVFQSAFAAEVTACASAAEALAQLLGGGFDLVLVNR